MLSSLKLGDGNNYGTKNGKIALDCSIRKVRTTKRRRRRRRHDSSNNKNDINNNNDNNNKRKRKQQQQQEEEQEQEEDPNNVMEEDKKEDKNEEEEDEYEEEDDDDTLYTISTTDFFFPLVDSPYLQGRIGAANVLSDLYAEGIDQCDFVLMLLAACRDMTPEIRTIVTNEMVRGFNDTCLEASTVITGGQTVLNPWPIIGGVATSIVPKHSFVPSNGAQPGNIIVLTKPLGTQVAVNVHQWRMQAQQQQQQQQEMDKNNNKKTSTTSTSSSSSLYWNDIIKKEILTNELAEDLMHAAVCSMVRLNRNAAKLMLKYHATAGTDITGFGILGHAQNLSENQLYNNNNNNNNNNNDQQNDNINSGQQQQQLIIELNKLPCLKYTKQINNEIFNFRLLEGYSAETSGGLLISFPTLQHATNYCNELLKLDNIKAHIVGKFVIANDNNNDNNSNNPNMAQPGKTKSYITSDVQIVEVDL